MSQKRRAKRAARPNPREDRNNVIEFRPNTIRRKKIVLIPRNLTQETYIDALEDDNLPIIVSAGPAGTGKTFLAALAALKAFNEGRYSKIVIARPNRAVDDADIGFLPGDIFKKMLPWMLPILDVFKEYYSTKEVEHMLECEDIEICPIAYIRGRTLKNAFIILDEAQGTTDNSMLAVLTRIGEGSKIVVTGDTRQSDIGERNGLATLVKKIEEKEWKGIKLVNFGHRDVERSEVVKEVLKMFGHC